MANYKVVDADQLDADLKTVADAIREKGGTTETLKFPLGMKSAIENIKSGSGNAKEEQEKTVDITENGTTEILPDEGKVLSKVTVNVDIKSEGNGGNATAILFSDFTTDGYNLPQVADCRSFGFPDESTQVNYANRFAKLFANASVNAGNGYYLALRDVYLPDGIKYLSAEMFQHCVCLENLYGDLSSVKYIGTNAFANCKALKTIPYMPDIDTFFANAFNGCTGLTEFKIYKKPSDGMNSTIFNVCGNILDIYVPWSEGEVANAPWGATNATIHYNTTYDENHNPIV